MNPLPPPIQWHDERSLEDMGLPPHVGRIQAPKTQEPASRDWAQLTRWIAAQERNRKWNLWAWGIGSVGSVIYILTMLGKLIYAGLGGLSVLILLLILLVPAILLLRAVLSPLLRAAFTKQVHVIARVVAIAVLSAGVIGYGYVIYKNLGPYDSVVSAVRQVPQMEEYFWENRDELETSRQQSASANEFFASYPRESRTFLSIGFYYTSTPLPKTGYVHTYEYAKMLEDGWYIIIYLHPAI